MRRMFDKDASLEEILTQGKRFFITTGSDSQQIDGQHKNFKERIWLKGRYADFVLQDKNLSMKAIGETKYNYYDFPEDYAGSHVEFAMDINPIINGETDIMAGTTNRPIGLDRETIDYLYSKLKTRITNNKTIPSIDIKIKVTSGVTEQYTTFMKLESYELKSNDDIILRFVSTRLSDNFRELAEITIKDDTTCSGVYNRLSL